MAKLNVKKRYSIRKSRLADLKKRLEEEIGESAGFVSPDGPLESGSTTGFAVVDIQ